ncbi:hypothetical protein [Lactococcus garvieae]|uniref:hypothetical protein n=1 Tax=Lactococcus garvieae TaxID=1363 RepID=UPI00254FD47C|nr:hypothetical protein [Lactococcus garvieae]
MRISDIFYLFELFILMITASIIVLKYGVILFWWLSSPIRRFFQWIFYLPGWDEPWIKHTNS